MNGSLELKVRPLRLAFLVDPKDKAAVLKAIEINSSLWGGTYNPIIPIYKIMPRSWRDKPLKAPKAVEVIKGYLNAFDPDIIVNLTKAGLPRFVQQLGIKIIKPEKVWEDFADHNYAPEFGIGIYELLNNVWEEHFRYKEKYPINVVLPVFQKKYELFGASVFGKLPVALLEQIDAEYKEPLEITTPKITPESFSEILSGNHFYPRKISKINLDEYSSRSFRDRHYVFFLDATNTADIIDYWNLRALGKSVMPVPIHLLEDEKLRVLVTDYLKQVHQPHRYQKHIFDHATFLNSRNVEAGLLRTYGENLSLDKTSNTEQYYVLQHWYPRIWSDWARDKDGVEPADVYANESRVEFNDVDKQINFSPLAPNIKINEGFRSEPRYANEVMFRFYRESEFLAQVFPKSSGQELLRAISGFTTLNEWRVARNGLTKLVNWTRPERWDIPTSEAVFLAWLKDLGWEASISTPGILAKRIFTQLDGSTMILKNEDLLKQLDWLNGGVIGDERVVTDERYVKVGEIKPKLGEHLTSYLLEKKVLRIGIEVQCPHCQRRSWFEINNLGETLDCPKCLLTYSSAGNIDKGQWCYKTVGPFSIPRFAEGGYCTLLGIDFLSNHLSSRSITPILSFTAVNPQKIKLEADFAVHWQESLFGTMSQGILFAECKSYNKFKDTDYKKMSLLAKQFPGAIIAFCTLRKILEKDEIKQITRITNAGRKYWKDDHPRNPVLVLTGTELFSRDNPPQCWKDLGFGNKFDRVHDLLSTCNATQQIHLGMASWHETWEKEFENKKKRRAKRQSRQVTK